MIFYEKLKNYLLFKEFCILFKSFNINSWTKKDFIQYLTILGVEQHSYNHLHVVRLIIRLIIEDVLKLTMFQREKKIQHTLSHVKQNYLEKILFR